MVMVQYGRNKYLLYPRSSLKLAGWAPTPLDCATLSVAPSIRSLAVLDGMMEQPGKLISRANKVDGRRPCGQSRGGGAPVSVDGQ